MQGLDAITLHRLAQELDGLWQAEPPMQGVRIQKVQQLGAQAWAFHLWGKALPHPNRLFVHVGAQAPLVALLSPKTIEQLFAGSEKNESKNMAGQGFTMLLRKYLTGARVKQLTTLPGEQVLNLNLNATDEFGDEQTLNLFIELMGKHSNLVLTRETEDLGLGVILGLAHRVDETQSRLRQLAVGLPYEPPPKPKNRQLLSQWQENAFEALAKTREAKTPEALQKLLLETTWGLNATLLKEIEQTISPKTPADWLKALTGLQQGSLGQPGLVGTGSTLYKMSLLAGFYSEKQLYPTVWAMLEAYYPGQWLALIGAQQKSRLTQVLHAAKTQVQKQLQQLIPPSHARIAQLQHYGECLLTAHSAGALLSEALLQERVELTDYQTGEILSIPYNPARSVPQNAQAFFRLARKAKTKAVIESQRSVSLHARQQYLLMLEALLQNAQTPAELLALVPDWQAAGLFKGRQGAGQTPKPSAKTAKLKAKLPKETTTGVLQLEPIAGWPIWVGKTATANAKISSTLAHAQDIWLHVQGGPSSHVLIKAQNPGKSIPNEILEAAAALAVWFSPFKPDGKAFVVYTLARYVKKIPGSWPGHVTYTHEKTLAVRLDNHPVQAWLDAAGRTV